MGLWFLVQYVLLVLSGASIIVKLLTFPAMTVGNTGFLAGTILFLVGGVALAIAGSRMPAGAQGGRSRSLFLGSTIALLAVVLVGLPLFVLLATRLSSAPVPEGVQVPTENEIFGWIEDVYNFGIRRTGTEADLQAIQYLQDKLREFGFTDVRAEPFTFDYWEPVSWSLTVQPGTDEAEQLECFYVPYSGPTGAEGVSTEMVYVGEGSEEDFAGADVAGKIVLVDLPPTNISWDQMKLFTLRIRLSSACMPGRWPGTMPTGHCSSPPARRWACPPTRGRSTRQAMRSSASSAAPRGCLTTTTRSIGWHGINWCR